jgi:hypothetical protein
MLLENGIYRAVVKDISLYLRGEYERLTAAFKVECDGKELVHREWIELNDGTISDKTIKRLRMCFPKWDGNIETLELGFCVQDVEVDITVENEQDKHDPAKWWTRVRFINPPGEGSSSAPMPDKENRGTLVSKYGSRFRALAHSTGSGQAHSTRSASSGQAGSGQAGGKPAGSGQGAVGSNRKTPSPQPSPLKGEGEERGGRTAPPVPSRVVGPESPVEPSTMEECWEALCKKYPDEVREQVGERWFEMLAKVIPGKDQADFDPQDWGRVMADMALPF